LVFDTTFAKLLHLTLLYLFNQKLLEDSIERFFLIKISDSSGSRLSHSDFLSMKYYCQIIKFNDFKFAILSRGSEIFIIAFFRSIPLQTRFDSFWEISKFNFLFF